MLDPAGATWASCISPGRTKRTGTGQEASGSKVQFAGRCNRGWVRSSTGRGVWPGPAAETFGSRRRKSDPDLTAEALGPRRRGTARPRPHHLRVAETEAGTPNLTAEALGPKQRGTGPDLAAEASGPKRRGKEPVGPEEQASASSSVTRGHHRFSGPIARGHRPGSRSGAARPTGHDDGSRHAGPRTGVHR